MKRQSNHFNELSDELLLIIFGHLSTEEKLCAARVCKRFGRVVKDRKLWNWGKMVVNFEMKYLDSRILSEITSFPFRIQHLNLTGAKVELQVLTSADKTAADSDSRLQKLNLTSVISTRRSLTNILRKFRPKELIMDRNCVGPNVLRAIAEIEDLERLSMDHVSFCDTDSRIFSRLLSGFRNLKLMTLRFTDLTREQLDDFAKEPQSEELNHFNKVSDELLLMIFKRLSTKERMNVAKVCQRFRRTVEDPRLWNSGEEKVYLKIKSLSSGELSEIISYPFRLEELNLTGAEVDSPVFASEASRAAGCGGARSLVRRLNLTSVKSTQQSLKDILRCCRPKELIMDRNYVGDEVLSVIGENQELEVLLMRHVKFPSHCSDRKIFRRTISGLYNLRLLNMDHVQLTVEQYNDLAYASLSSRVMMCDHITVIKSYPSISENELAYKVDLAQLQKLPVLVLFLFIICLCLFSYIL